MDEFKKGDRVYLQMPEFVIANGSEGTVSHNDHGCWVVNWDDGETSHEWARNLRFINKFPRPIAFADIQAGDTVQSSFTKVEMNTPYKGMVRTTNHTHTFVVDHVSYNLLVIKDSMLAPAADSPDATWTLLARPETLKIGDRITHKNKHLVPVGAWVTQYLTSALMGRTTSGFVAKVPEALPLIGLDSGAIYILSEKPEWPIDKTTNS